MLLRRLLKKPEMGSWVTLIEFLAAMATLIATLMALKVVPSPFGGPPLGTVSGVIMDAQSGQPVTEATVQLMDNTNQVIAAEAQPDANGKWAEKVKPGSYTIKAVCDGYRPASKSVSVAESKVRVVRLSIAAQPKDAEQSAAGTPAVRTETRIIQASAPSGSGGGSVSEPPQRSTQSAQATSSDAPSSGGADRQIENLMSEAKKLNNAAKYDQAVDKLIQASNLDSTDGRIYALAIKIRLNQPNDAGLADAKSWHEDGMKSATKHKNQVEDAYQ